MLRELSCDVARSSIWLQAWWRSNLAPHTRPLMFESVIELDMGSPKQKRAALKFRTARKLLCGATRFGLTPGNCGSKGGTTSIFPNGHGEIGLEARTLVGRLAPGPAYRRPTRAAS